jgi:hypothetical protein
MTTATYKGQTVTVVRPAKDGDDGFDKHKGAQSLIKLKDGTEKVVATTDVATGKPADPSAEIDPKTGQAPPAGGS